MDVWIHIKGYVVGFLLVSSHLFVTTKAHRLSNLYTDIATTCLTLTTVLLHKPVYRVKCILATTATNHTLTNVIPLKYVLCLFLPSFKASH